MLYVLNVHPSTLKTAQKAATEVSEKGETNMTITVARSNTQDNTTWSPNCERIHDDGDSFWFEEETIVEEPVEESEFTEVTYESECLTDDDILLETLPPAPPLVEASELSEFGELKERKLLEALRKMRDEGPNKTTVPGTTQDEMRPKSLPKPHLSKAKKPIEHRRSPRSVWVEPVHVASPVDTETSPQQRKGHRSDTSPRVRKIDSIILRQGQRRSYSVQSGGEKQQMVSLQKLWKERIDCQMEALSIQLSLLEKDLARTQQQIKQMRNR